jgi:hypothetical protein
MYCVNGDAIGLMYIGDYMKSVLSTIRIKKDIVDSPFKKGDVFKEVLINDGEAYVKVNGMKWVLSPNEWVSI